MYWMVLTAGIVIFKWGKSNVCNLHSCSNGLFKRVIRSNLSVQFLSFDVSYNGQLQETWQLSLTSFTKFSQAKKVVSSVFVMQRVRGVKWHECNLCVALVLLIIMLIYYDLAQEKNSNWHNFWHCDVITNFLFELKKLNLQNVQNHLQ